MSRYEADIRKIESELTFIDKAVSQNNSSPRTPGGATTTIGARRRQLTPPEA
jgi:hypothetical protein